ncbi:hypothetical protein K491DRAFT_697851 [Lophiostoma macrostomum CBS 122681]|uniref:Glutathione S-transferase n=1 Tax=Lophiostoma macrostomum CBS 122681 TaxID=1314788 RepID=A0A6A6SPH7_9PLEO|nr:hypothetical protein K491DRAFT_697851 [Lophiostoma macrostomum CBS 122681]
MTIQIYCDPCTINSRKVLAGLQQLKADYNQNFIDYFTGQQKSDEFKKINPCATVPAATDGDLTLTESNAILQYAADVVGDESMYPKDLKKRANINRWLLWEASVWFGSCYIYLIENVVKPDLMNVPTDEKAIETESTNFHKLAGILDTQLAKTKWLTGDDVTIADFAIAAPMHLHEAAKLPLEQYPNLKRWMTEGMERLDSWKDTQGAVEEKILPGKQTTNGTNGTNDTNGTSGQPDIKTTVNYTKAVDGLTELYFYETDAAKNIHEPGDDPFEISISDAWPHAQDLTLDTNGFSVHSLKTSHTDWEDESSVKSSFYPEVVDFLKQTTGATRVLVFDHTIRTEANSKKKLTDENNTSQRSPVMLVHCDYTAKSGPLRVKQLLGSEADDLLSRRVSFVNVWKPINRVVEERPLAMCDVKSCKDEDFFKLILRYRDRTGENYVMKHSKEHKWWYFPKMTPEQVVLLKTFDSAGDGTARFVGHTAFVDPSSPEDAPMRESIEIRTICFY